MPKQSRRAWPSAMLVLACFAILSGLLPWPGTAHAAPEPDRVALVIGNSRYEALGMLANADEDAEAVAATLEALGYAVRLVTDADEITLRREIRTFAGSSATASLALVYYAGHGAQVGGENYLLPTDMGIPERETDILLTGFKVDDLVNGLQAQTKVVFLDACRDNPALVQNLVTGRGGVTRGLAPAVGSNIAPDPGGGVFIAYATDSGAVALDGDGEHSPFAEALLRHMREPISIDDMFALVTRDVRASTENAQRPYKYASLESIVCLTGPCGVALPAPNNDDGSISSALSVIDIDATRRSHDEWTIFDLHGEHAQYLRMSSIERFGTRRTVDIRSRWVNTGNALDLSVDSYWLTRIVMDCQTRSASLFEEERTAVDGTVIDRSLYGDPRFIELNLDVTPENALFPEWKMLCGENIPLPINRRGDGWEQNYLPLLTFGDNAGTARYRILETGNTEKPAMVVAVSDYAADKLLSDLMPPDMWGALALGTTEAAQFTGRTVANVISLDCNDAQMSVLSSEFYTADEELLLVKTFPDNFESATLWEEITPDMPENMVRMAACGEGNY